MAANGILPPTPSTTIDLELQNPSTASMAVASATTTAKRPRSIQPRFRAWMKPSERTIYRAILGTADGMTVPFAVMASLAGVSDARLVILAGLAELIAGAVSMGAGGILGAKSDEERHHAELRRTSSLIVTSPTAAIDRLTTSLSADLPGPIIASIEAHYDTLPILAKAQLVMRFHNDPEPGCSDTYKAATTFFLTYFSGLPALLPYLVVIPDRVNLAFLISIGITAVLSFVYGWTKTGYNVGWSGWQNVRRGICGGFMFFTVVALAATLSVVVIRGIDHNL